MLRKNRQESDDGKVLRGVGLLLPPGIWRLFELPWRRAEQC